jgi:hypothetical protein
VPATPTYGLRWPAPADTPDVPRDLGYLASDCDTAMEELVPVAGGVQLVTALPASPVSGQMIVLTDAARSYAWLCQYDPATPAPHRWLVLGGSDLFVKVNATEWTSAGNYATLAGGPVLLLPYAGVWQLEAGAEPYGPTSGLARASLYVAGTAASDNDAISAKAGLTALSGSKKMAQRTIAAKGGRLELYYRSTAGVQGSFGKRWIRAMPVRIS